VDVAAAHRPGAPQPRRAGGRAPVESGKIATAHTQPGPLGSGQEARLADVARPQTQEKQQPDELALGQSLTTSSSSSTAATTTTTGTRARLGK